MPQGWQTQQMAPPPPKPERTIGPCIAWAVGLNVLWGILCALLILALGAVLLSFIGSVAPREFDASELRDSRLALVIVGLGAVVAVVGTITTIVALILLRLGSAFRRLPPFVQALIAAVAGYIASSILSAIVNMIWQLSAAATMGTGQ